MTHSERHTTSASGTARDATDEHVSDAHDRELVQRALAGSLPAWQLLVRRHEGRIYNYSLRLTGNRDDAMDLMQEVFLGVYRNLERFRGESQFISWVFRIAHNKAVDMARRRKASPVRQHAEHENQDDWSGAGEFDGNPQALALEDENNAKVRRLLQALSPEQRLVVELKVFQGMTFDEIELMQNLSANSAKSRFYAALKKLRMLMETQNELSPDP